MKKPVHKQGRHTRRGAILIVSLVCLGVIVALLSQLMWGAMRQRRQLHAERDRRQCELLAEAGIARATTRRAADAKYRGEKWELPADPAAGLSAATITIEPVAEGSPDKLQVIAEYPTGSPLSIRRTRTISITDKPNQPSEKP